MDIRSKKILSIKVTYEHVHVNKALPELVENIIKSNKTVVGKLLFDDDCAYDGNEIFNYIDENEILPYIKVKECSN